MKCREANAVYEAKIMRVPRREVYAKGGIGALYGGGMARTARLCGAFFIINNIREAAIQYKTKKEQGE